MMLLVIAVLLGEATIINCSYVNSSHVPDLTEVPDNIPSGETWVSLAYNAISSLDGRLDHITNLQVLMLQHNKFVMFPNITLLGDTLRNLDLSHNDIAGVRPAALSPLIMLTHLQLNENNIAIFPNLTLVGDTLLDLGLGGNGISEIDPALITPFIQLKILRISPNNFATFPYLTPVGDTLERLYLHDNDIVEINPLLLTPLVKLNRLYLHNTKLNQMPDVSALSLNVLDLRDNQIHNVGLKEMQALSGIQDVDLRNNGFLSLPPVCFDKPTKVNVQGSDLQLCACNNIWLKKEVEKGNLTLDVTDVTCTNATKPWTQMTHEELVSVCQPMEPFILHSCHKGEKIILYSILVWCA